MLGLGCLVVVTYILKEPTAFVYLLQSHFICNTTVYKLDRISRSILDFANMMELFQEYDVEFVSSTEKFDTSTPHGPGHAEYLYRIRPA